MPRKTICDALKQLKHCLMLIVYRCVKANRAFSMNNYMLTVWGDWTVEQASVTVCPQSEDSHSFFSGRGGNFFGELPVRTKITNGFYLEGKGLGVFEFGKSNKTLPDLSGFAFSEIRDIHALMSILEGQFGDIPWQDGIDRCP